MQLPIQSLSEYSSDGHQKTSSTDANNVRSDYTYSSTTRNPLSSKVGGSSDTQNYSYFTRSNRLKQTYISGKAAILYSYENGTLTWLQRKAFPDTNSSNAFYQRYNLTNDSFGNQLSVSVSGSNDGTNYSSSIALFSNTYESGVNNGRLHSSTYSNGDTVTYSYDLFDRIVEESYTGTVNDTRHRVYDGMGNIAEETATSGSQTERYTYQYDGLGRLYHSCAYIGDSQTIATSYFYDTANRLKRQSWNIRNAGFTQLHSYSSSDGLIESICNAASVPGNGTGALNPTATYTYNSLRQPTRKTVSFDNGNGAGNTEKFYRALSYRTISGNRTSNQITYLNYRKAVTEDLILGFKYGYDKNGRISSIKPSLASGGADNSKAITYTYDGMGQLTDCTDKSSGSTVNYHYKYDTAGNIREADKGSTTINYSYENASWKDLLTKITIGTTERSISYAAPGLPSNWYNGSDYTFTWKKGTQLATATKGSTTTTYSYDMNGVRSAKTVGSTTYQFDTLSGKVMHQTGAGRELWFVYDENDQPYMLITRNGTTVDEYFYLLNAQGDVVGIIDRDGTLVATYSYDPFGAPVSTWTLTGNNIGEINPLRYRGYFYDFESGFYYLQSRYYDPIVGRFISSDTFATTDANGFLSCNMFAYCENNPVNRSDPDGYFPRLISLRVQRLIHNEVAKKVAKRVRGLENVYVKKTASDGTVKRGFLDVYDYNNNTYYEIKSVLDKDSSRTKKQMEKYNGFLFFSRPNKIRSNLRHILTNKSKPGDCLIGSFRAWCIIY